MIVPRDPVVTDRRDLAAPLRAHLSHLKEDEPISPTLGGRTAALQALRSIQPRAYGQTRNFLSGDVTHLSAYLRHGVLTLAEVRDSALEGVDNPTDAAKLINELAWRDYWQRLYTVLSEGIWEDQEPYKTGWDAGQYAHTLPDDIPAADTTLVCIDSFTRDLQETGYLHNHARLWFASYIVHWRQVSWQVGAQWFLEHLIDGDPASNNLSWQWVASTFATAPYIFNKDNLERYTASRYCSTCSHAGAGTCPFDETYDTLQKRLFPQVPSNTSFSMSASSQLYAAPKPQGSLLDLPKGKPLLWHHTDSLNPDSLMLRSYHGAPAVFIWDAGWLAQNHISLKRVLFIAECLQQMPDPIQVRIGDPLEELLTAVRHAGADYVVAQRTPDPRLKAAAAAVEAFVPLVWLEPPSFVESSRGLDLKRFSRYWKRAQTSALRPTGISTTS